jgi:hypothetical protein
LEQRLFDDVQGRLAVFGDLDAARDPALLERGALVGQLARAVHARYLVEYAGSSPAQDSHVRWEQLDERYWADNRAQAEHIGTKLAEIDAVIVPAAPDLPPFTLAEGPQGDVEKLARMEHDRWMAALPSPYHRSDVVADAGAGATSAQCVDRAVEQGSGRPKSCGLYRATEIARIFGRTVRRSSLWDISPLTVLSFVASLADRAGRGGEFVPTVAEAIDLVQGRVCLVDGTITSCWSYADNDEL